MPAPSHAPSEHSTRSRQAFCVALKAARERKGMTLAEIADTTKVPASLFAALERNDVRRWPRGLFRRAFFRDYARMIGLPVAEACEEFVRLFPEDERAERTTEQAEEANEARLAFDSAWHGPRASVLSRMLAATIDAGVVILAAGALVWVAGTDQAATTATVALAYFSLATALFGESPAKRVIARRRSVLYALAHGPAVIAAAWRRGADAISRLSGNAGGTPEPAPSSRLRVRFKLSP